MTREQQRAYAARWYSPDGKPAEKCPRCNERPTAAGDCFCGPCRQAEDEGYTPMSRSVLDYRARVAAEKSADRKYFERLAEKRAAERAANDMTSEGAPAPDKEG